jgi:Protein of unknown function (DUF3631)
VTSAKPVTETGTSRRTRLLYDVRDVFERLTFDRISTSVLLAELFDLPDARWSEPKLTDRRLASLLAPFKIKPKVLWPACRTNASKSFRGYLRIDFAEAWNAYCDGGVTPSHASNILPTYEASDPSH